MLGGTAFMCVFLRERQRERKREEREREREREVVLTKWNENFSKGSR